MKVKINFKKKFEFLISLWKILSRKRKKQLFILLLINLFCAASEFTNLILIRFFLGGITDKLEFKNLGFLSEILQKIPENKLIVFMGCFVILFLFFSTLLRISAIFIQYRIGPLLAVDLGSKIYNKIINNPYSWHINSNTSSALGTLSYDVERIRDSIIASLNLIINIFLVLFISIPLFLVEPKLIFILVSIITILFGIIYKFNRTSLQTEGLLTTKNYESGLKLVSESLNSIKDILIDHNQIFFLKKYIKKFQTYNISFGKMQTYYQAPKYIVEVTLICLVIIISLILYSSEVKEEINFPIIGIILFGIYKLLIPFQQVYLSISLIKSSSSSWIKIKPYLTYEKINNDNYKYIEKTKDRNISDKNQIFIKLKNLSFRYNNDSKFIIKDLNLSISKGQKVGFVGYSGSGKTTCGDLISGLLRPTNGFIIVEGKDINKSKVNLINWHNSFAFVPQDIYLMEDSIINNIAFGIPEEEIIFSKVLEVSKKACLHKSIMELTHGYSEVIGEKGKKLSGGQIQRLAIARALYKEANCIIFDEATSALDNKTENDFMQSLKNLDNNLTIILIAHRLSTIKDCDFLVFFEKDCNISIGTYEELLKVNIRFRKFLNTDIS